MFSYTGVSVGDSGEAVVIASQDIVGWDDHVVAATEYLSVTVTVMVVRCCSCDGSRL